MSKHPLELLLSFALLVVIAAPSLAAPVKKEEVEYQNDAFKTWWETDLVWKFDDLPTQGVVPKYRVPYSGHDYPDRSGGTMTAMRKYDAAFSRTREGSAASYEHEDVTNHGKGVFKGPVREGSLFGRIRMRRSPHWYGHCNGWTAAAIRHAEPTKNVTRNGVTFTPADIKGMLAEIYMYNDHEFCGGLDDAINPATLHVVISNWLGRGTHPIGMDTTIGKEVWNYPIYSYAIKAKPIDGNDKKLDVWMTAVYARSTTQEFDESPRHKDHKYFHYTLDLNDKGEITGGEYFNNSDRIDILWTPLQPVQGGKKGNERGNPHLDVKEVLAIWRESAPETARKKWLNIDPTEEDRIAAEEEKEEDVAETTEADSEETAETKPADETKPAAEAEADNEDVADATAPDSEPADDAEPSEEAPRTAAAEDETETE